MSTDTAVLTAFTIFRHGVTLNQLRFVDDPEVYKDQIGDANTGITSSSSVVHKPTRGYRESSRIRMRYLTRYQPALKDKPSRVPLPPGDDGNSERLADSGAVRHLWGPESFNLPRFEEDDTSTLADGKAKGKNHELMTLPKMTPDLLEFIFQGLDDALDGALEVGMCL